jgi:hypothetical protein
MTTEPTVPQPELGSAPANGQGQSQGHRRRRRRRKNKTNQPAGQPQGQFQPNQAQPSAPQMQAPPPQQPRQQQGGPPKEGSGRHRKKKKFFQQKSGAPQPGPGNSIAPQHNNGNGRRKERQKGPRTFVGPMDHSYRIVNGNVADGPPSTIPTQGNGHHGYYSDANVGSPTVPVKADAPTRIFCFIDDLFFQAKIQETARKLGVKVEFVKGEKETVARIIDSPEAPTLVVFDLNNLNAKPMTLIPKFKTKFKKATSIIGFLNHLQGDLKMKAIESGCDTVMPRSAFSQSLPNLLRRYGMEEEEDNMPQPM